MITSEQYAELKARNDALNTWIDSIRTRNGWASYKPEDKPTNVPDVTNAERSQIEVYEFVTNPPTKYFLYISESKALATTWTGETLGTVSFGREYRSSCRDKRVPVTVHAINGRVYHGTYFKSAGDYARVKAGKA